MTDAAQSRRETLRRAALAAGALAATGILRPAVASAQTEDEELRDFLVEAVALEQVTVLAYSTAADQAGADLKAQLEEFRHQEQAHANALRSAIDELGYDAPDAPDSPADTGVLDDVEGLDEDAATGLTDRLSELADANGLDQLIDVLMELEREQVTFYCTEGPQLSSYDLAGTVASIAGCQAQHLAVLGAATGSPGDAAASVAELASRAAGDATTGE